MLNILSARKSVKNYYSPTSEAVKISCNIHCINSSGSLSLKLGIRNSSCHTSKMLSMTSFDKAQNALLILCSIKDSSDFKVILRRRRLTSVSTGRDVHSYAWRPAHCLLQPVTQNLVPALDPDRCSFLFVIVRRHVRPPSAIRSFSRMPFERMKFRRYCSPCILMTTLTCGGGSQIEESPGCPI